MLVIPRLVQRAGRAAARWSLRGAQWYTRRSEGLCRPPQRRPAPTVTGCRRRSCAAAAPRGGPVTLSRPLQGSWEASFGPRLAPPAFSAGNRPSGFLEDANLSPRRCKRTALAPFRPKAHLATLKSASGPLRRRRARPDHSNYSQIQQKVRLPGQRTPQTHIRSVHVAPALVPARGIRQ